MYSSITSHYYSQAANAVLKTMLFDTTDFQFDNKQFNQRQIANKFVQVHSILNAFILIIYDSIQVIHSTEVSAH